MDITDEITQWPTDSSQLHLFLWRLSGKSQIQHLLAPHISRINWVVVACSFFFFFNLLQGEIKKKKRKKTLLSLRMLFYKGCFGAILSAAELVEGWCRLHCPSLSCEAVCWYLGRAAALPGALTPHALQLGSELCLQAEAGGAVWGFAMRWENKFRLFLFYVFYIFTISEFVFTFVVSERWLLLLPNLM